MKLLQGKQYESMKTNGERKKGDGKIINTV
jgi:hypothetical protein